VEISSILYATDGSPHARKALDWVVDIAVRRRAKVIIVTAYECGGTRLTVEIEDRVGALEEVVRVIRDCQVNIRSLAAYVVDGTAQAVIRLETPYPLHVVQALAEQGIKVVHLAPLPEVKQPESKVAAR